MAVTEQITNFNISEDVTVIDEGNYVKIIDTIEQGFVVVTYGKELDNLIRALLYLSNSNHYGLENKEPEWLALKHED